MATLKEKLAIAQKAGYVAGINGEDEKGLCRGYHSREERMVFLQAYREGRFEAEKNAAGRKEDKQ